MQNISVFGLLSGLTVLVAWVSDMFLAPALILVLKPFGKEREQIKESVPRNSIRTVVVSDYNTAAVSHSSERYFLGGSC